MDKININELHNILLNIAKEFHKICERNNIPYYMLGGTMLGAIRHKGFIPWDDDMDFGIPREYYQKFVDLCKTDLPDPYCMLTMENSDYAILGFGKMSDSRTVFNEIFSIKTSQTIGVNIDIFPLDNANDRKFFFSYNWCIRKLFKFQKLLFMQASNRDLLRKILAAFCQQVFPIKKYTIPHYIERQMLSKIKDKELPVWVNYYGGWGLKELIPKTVFGAPTLYPFEDTELYGLNVPDSYLTSLYGDYMILPPEDKRHIHACNYYWE